MTEEQKRFKILKRTSYEEQISQENKEATKNTFLFGLSAAAAISILSAAAQQNIDAATKLLHPSNSVRTSVYYTPNVAWGMALCCPPFYFHQLMTRT